MRKAMFKLVLKYVKGSARIFAVIAPLMMLLEVFMDLQQPTLMSDIIDIGVANRDMNYVLHTGLQMIVYAIIGFIGGALCSLAAGLAAVNMSGQMRQGLFDKIQSLSFAEIDHFKTSSLVTRLTNDVMQMQSMMLMMLRIMVRAPLITLGGIVMSFLLNAKLALLFCILLPIVVTSIILVLQKSVPLFSQVQERLDKVNTVMRENLLGVRVVKSFSLEQRESERFKEANDALTGKSIRAQNVTFLLMPVVTLVMNISVVAVLWFGGNMVQTGSLETGKIMAFINYLVQITNSLVMGVNLIINVSRAQASSVRINEVLDIEPSITEPREPISPANYDVEFRNVSFRYDESGDFVLKNISFTMKQGNTVGIIGATGSGKSSLISLIPRLYDVSDGQVLIGGVDIRQVSLHELRRKIGIVMQDSLLFSGTIASNLTFGKENASEAELDGAASDAQATEFISTLVQKYSSPAEQRGRNFSGGQKQRLSLARTLLQDPEILILDDSTSAVDLRTESYLRAALADRMKERTVIIIAQRISAVMDADKIIVLDFGRVAAEGTHEELLCSSEIYRSIAVSQLGEEVLAYAGC